MGIKKMKVIFGFRRSDAVVNAKAIWLLRCIITDGIVIHVFKKAAMLHLR